MASVRLAPVAWSSAARIALSVMPHHARKRRVPASEIFSPRAWDNSDMTSTTIPAAAAGTWTLGDLTVNRLGFGAMRLAGGRPFDPAALPSNRDQAIAVLRRAIDLGVNHIDTAAFYFSA